MAGSLPGTRTRPQPWLLWLALPAGLAACGGAPEPGPLPRARELLRREDERAADPAGWTPLLADPDPALRLRAARAVGRTRAPGLTGLAVERLAREPEPAVREELLFALGQLQDPRARAALLGALDQAPTPAERARAAEALGKLPRDPAAWGPLCAALDPHGDPALIGAAALALGRLYGARSGAAPLDATEAAHLRERLVPLTSDPRPDVRWRAVYALAELVSDGDLPDPDLSDPAAPLLDVLRAASGPQATLDGALRDRQVVARIFAARGLTRLARAGRLRDPSPLEGLLPAASDPHLAAALAGLLAAVATAPGPSPAAPPAEPPPAGPPPWLVSELVAASSRLSSPVDHHVRAAALQALQVLSLPAPPPPPGAPLPAPLPERVERAIRARLQDESVTVRSLALTVWTRLLPAGAAEEVQARADRPDPLDRLGAASAAALLPELSAGPLLERLARDPDPRVACEALSGLAQRLAPARARSAAREALAHADLAVRATGLELLAERGLLADAGAVASGYLGAPGAELVEVRQGAVAAALAILGRARLGRTARDAAPRAGELLLSALLTRSLSDVAAVASPAGEALRELTGRAPPRAPDPPLRSTIEVTPGDDLLRPSDAPPIRVALETRHGALVCELYPEAAPRHVRSFLDLARRGFYDGLRIHRVVTGFVVQGLDPRGDGWGSGGVVLRDEINPVPYLTGTLGMPNAGPDTGGCQLFVTHIPTPHLDGRYTVFGRVVAGIEVLDALEVGDVVQRVRRLD